MMMMEKIKTAFERNVKALTLRPAIGRGTAVTTVSLQEGMTCEIEEGAWKIIADMSDKHGGNNQGPNPGIFGRAALGSCLAIGYMRWAAKLGVPISKIDIEVQTDYDARGEYGVAKVPVGYTGVRYIVSVESDAPAEVIRHLIDVADAHSSLLEVFAQPQEIRREVKINQAQVEEAKP